MKIIITGGPVHAKIDAVKFVTNRFKGGLIAKLADDLCRAMPPNELKVIYLCSKDSKTPSLVHEEDIVFHDGFNDYRDKVKEIAVDCDAVILGAAVANLIPVFYDKKDGFVEPLPLVGKFPSHDYKPGDTFQITWQIAPRIIDEVKDVIKPGGHVFGFKLLSDVDHEELIDAAYEVLLGSHATAVFANDAKDLNEVIAVTKERGEHPMQREGIAQFVLNCVKDKYYKTVVLDEEISQNDKSYFKQHLDKADANRFLHTKEGYVFGTVAARHPSGKGFLTTARGKKEIDGVVWVKNIDHKNRVITTVGGKATLNAPLLDNLLKYPSDGIRHYHDFVDGVPNLSYAPPGTARDSMRKLPFDPTLPFNIENHGCFEPYRGQED